ncbi:MAG TPA: CPBP family intramembrane glutamic endopeptidase [Thermoanaerobaculia bacterium]|nr:CPBP family intramembrane glutamic endopeptidase [Thermoanaerobaculia bacterium]
MKSKWVVLYLAVYAVALTLFAVVEKQNPVEPLFSLLVIGGGFTFVAWLLTKRVTPVAGISVRAPWPLLTIYFLALTAIVTWGFSLVPNEFVKGLLKLVVFVAVPMALFRMRLPLRMNRRDAAICALLIGLMMTFQIAFGSGVRKIADTDLRGGTLLLATLASFLWMSIEAGVVEEVAFRGLLQTRLHDATPSAAGAIVISALLFALIHAPGLYLRTASTGESFTHPSLLYAICFSITVLSPMGLFFGMLWSRTRNILLVVLVHGAVDTIPHVVEVARALRMT